MAAMPMVARHHAVAVASVVDPELATATTRGAEGARSTPIGWRSPTTCSPPGAWSERGSARSGAEMVEAQAGSLAAACVRAYVRAKLRARL